MIAAALPCATHAAAEPARFESTVLHPGDVVLGQRGAQLSTLLGSCVAIILVDPRRTVGVMSHVVYVRHEGRTREDEAAAPKACTQGQVALLRMTALLQAQGIDARQCQAYVYGGGNMFPGVYTHDNVGDSNVRWALQALAALGIELLHHDVGGTVYRKLSWTVGPEQPQVVSVPI